MKLLYRRILLIVIFVLFIIIVPVVLLYAYGFRYDFQKNKLIKVGLLYIETAPKVADVYLNDKLYKKRTPARMNNLIPDEYTIKIKKEGYFVWGKKIEIESENATIYKDIILFKNNQVIKKISNDDIKFNILSPDSKKTIYLVNDEKLNNLKIFNIAKENIETIKTVLPANISDVIWSPDSQKILIKTIEEKYYIYDIGYNQFIRLSEIFQRNIKNVKWSETANNIYVISDSKLYESNYLTGDKKIILEKELVGYQINNNNIYYLERKNDNLILYKYDLKSKQSAILKNYESSDKIEFKNCPLKNYILLYNTANQTLNIINKNSDNNIEKFPNKVKDFSFSSDNKQILYFNDYEIWIYNIENGENNLITRTSEVISQAVFHPLQQNIIYLKKSQINIIEVAGPIRNNYELTANIDSLICDLKGENIYFLLDENDKKILSTVNIR